jgi:hypothetical protein
MLKIATKQHVDGFSKKWTHNGVAIFLDDVHKQFAIDFANMIVTSVIDQQQKAAAAAAKPKIISTEV